MTNCSITALRFNKFANRIVVGTKTGELYIYDVDINKILYKMVDIKVKVIEIRLVEALKKIFIFWENHRMRVLDAFSLEVVQEVRNDLVFNCKANLAYMTDIDLQIDYKMVYEKKKREVPKGERLKIEDVQ